MTEKTSCGFFYIAFGCLHELYALVSVLSLRQYSKLPIVLVTDLKEKQRDPRWDEIKNLTVIVSDLPNKTGKENRHVKLQLYKYSPFDYTFYLDCDTLIVSKRLNKIFSIFNKYPTVDIVFRRFAKRVERQAAKIKAIADYHEEEFKPEMVERLRNYHGCCFLFRKSEHTIAFFDRWYALWLKRQGRDMPHLAWAVYSSSDLNLFEFEADMVGSRKAEIIRHYAGAGKRKIMGKMILEMLGKESYKNFKKWFVHR